jgi:hypothetical protein
MEGVQGVGSVPALIISKIAGVSSSVCWKDYVTRVCASFNMQVVVLE